MSTFLFLNQVHWNISHTTLSTRRTADGARGECFNINFELIPNIPWPSFPLETQARGQDGCTVQLANDDVRCVEYVRSVTLIDLIALGTISVSSWNGHHLFRLPLVRANIDMVRNIEVQRGGRDEITNTSPCLAPPPECAMMCGPGQFWPSFALRWVDFTGKSIARCAVTTLMGTTAFLEVRHLTVCFPCFWGFFFML